MSRADFTNDIDSLQRWIGRSMSLTETISTSWCRKMEETLGREASLLAGDSLPPLWHFITHLTSAPLDQLGRDGHPARGGFLPPVALPRRMWAGGRFKFDGTIALEDEVCKTSTIKDVVMKQGRTGALCFVTVLHELSVAGDVRLTEEQDIVYREDPASDAPALEVRPAPVDYDFQCRIEPSEVLLFRYSALTFNGHRIHYDRDYCKEVEGYPDLVFHGPLTATLLADLAVRETGRPLTAFSFRAQAPLFADAPVTLNGTVADQQVRLWATTPEGGLAMEASAVLSAFR